MLPQHFSLLLCTSHRRADLFPHGCYSTLPLHLVSKISTLHLNFLASDCPALERRRFSLVQRKESTTCQEPQHGGALFLWSQRTGFVLPHIVSVRLEVDYSWRLQ